MRISLEFDTGNCAFDDDPHEPARILHEAANRIDGIANMPSEYPLRDINGNRVGTLKIEESE